MDALLQEAIAEAYASAPQDVQIWHTVEITHRSFTEPARIVRHPINGPKPKRINLRLEDVAIYNPGQVVEFIAVPFDVRLPEKSMDTPGEFIFHVSGVGDLLDISLENAAMHGGGIQAVYREFIVGKELDGPVMWWPGISLRSPYIDPQSGDLYATGTVLDWLNRRYGRLYTPGKYPALVGG